MSTSATGAFAVQGPRKQFVIGGCAVVVLGVDDDPINLKVCKAFVEAFGYQFAGASSGEEALRMLETVRPHIILLDVMMPGLDGFETCRKIRQMFQGAGPRVIYLTARNQTEDFKQARETDADDFLVKPIQMAVLEVRLRHWLDRAPRERNLLSAARRDPSKG